MKTNDNDHATILIGTDCRPNGLYHCIGNGEPVRLVKVCISNCVNSLNENKDIYGRDHCDDDLYLH